MRLGVNIDHVATIRQARGGTVPSPAEAAGEAEAGGADGITAHLREDRRHIRDSDLPEIRRRTGLPINLEMAPAPEIVRAALKFRPEKVCIVPEKRRELTTEGGLDAFAQKSLLARLIPKFHKKKIRVSLFLNSETKQIRAAAEVGADAVEIHTGAYARRTGAAKKRELAGIREAAGLARRLGMEVHAGHGLDYENVAAICKIPEIAEVNIGHSIVSRAVFTGMREAVREMKRLVG